MPLLCLLDSLVNSRRTLLLGGEPLFLDLDGAFSYS